jgi:hypothetical protein
MGPAKDMRKLFEGTMEKIKMEYADNYDLNTSDQLYFSDLWADQEYRRLAERYGEDKVPVPHAAPTTLPGIALPTNFPGIEKEPVFVPDLETTSSTDFHMALEYESRMFQTVAFYENYIFWKSFNETETFIESDRVSRRKLHIPSDLLTSPKPFSAIKRDNHLKKRSWTDVTLGLNGASGHIFTVLHVTGDKTYRDKWWPRMWYFPYAEKLLLAARHRKQYNIGNDRIEKITWQKDVPYANHGTDKEVDIGAWVDKGVGGHMSWDELCGLYEPIIFSAEMPERPDEEIKASSTINATTRTPTPDPLPYWSKPPGGRRPYTAAT